MLEGRLTEIFANFVDKTEEFKDSLERKIRDFKSQTASSLGNSQKSVNRDLQ